MDDIPLIPRNVLFGNPQRTGARLSPDGKWLSFQAPVDGVMNVWVAPVDDLSKAFAVTKEKVRPVPTHNWAYDNQATFYTSRIRTVMRIFTSTPRMSKPARQKTSRRSTACEPRFRKSATRIPAKSWLA